MLEMLLVMGGGTLAGKKLAKKLLSRETTVGKLKRLDPRIPQPPKLWQRVDASYQHLFQTKIDTLFGTEQRSQQMQEFSGQYNDKEADINRRIGMSLVTTKLALLGALVYQPLSWVSAAGLLFIMGPLFKRSLHTMLRERRIKYRFVGALSVLSSLAAGYYVVSSLLSVVVFSAFKLAARTEAYSQASLMNTFALQPPATVWVQVAGVETEISFADVQIGDIIVLSAGQTVPVDGHITEGAATIDQHVLTGEAQPVEKTLDDPVLANTLVLTGKIYVRVEQTGNDTAAAQIGNILGNMTSQRLEHEARSERLADKLTFPVLAASGLAMVTIGPAGAAAIMNSGFGSIMFFSGPVSMLSHLNLASHHGILVKDGRSLEKLHEVDTVVFDKTGTLTLEQPEVSHIHCCADWQETDILTFAALAEYRQSHPVAKAILTAAEQHGLELTVPDDAAYTVGFGVQVNHQGKTIQVGSQRFMQQAEVAIPPMMETVKATCQESGNSLIFVAVNGQLAGALELQAQLRPDTVNMVRKLHQRGLKLCILSGDHRQPTEHLAKRLGIDDVFAEVLPEGKADKIRELQEAGRTVCFVGDGINDAIALQQADVSVSLRGATSVATDSAQIVLMTQSLQQLDQLFEIAYGFNKNLDQTMRMAYIPGTVLIGGVFLLHFGMTAALVLYGGGVTAAMSKALSPLRQLSKTNTKPSLIHRVTRQ
ncbi:heavy metal translocating P-type ATPase [Thiothrix fructosivorans]|uniref:P-type Zn(2+) transporter n=1 Tax=Thiothrix fructosivorans TaxID=111770 RepID=A0A8B0SM56_9GAMM|nr:heavy metal translocating P-type ATPase [Thiothrix fructosivorans]MBO0615227.1 heavy metal translocating P-type ATPase [Thiothrix fructosivorans]QTX10012.1 heavy metal translocating P-type ATPase [Thiothrix fructosivorans]